MDPRVLVGIAIVFLGAGAALSLTFLRRSRSRVGAARHRALMGGATICYAVAGFLLLFAAYQF